MANAIKVPRATPLEYRVYDCEPDVSVNDIVYLSDDNKVDKAQANDVSKKALGFCVKKKSATKCVVSDELVINGTFELNKEYFLSDQNEGEFIDQTPTNSGSFVQSIGFAESTTKLIGKVVRDILVRN